MRNVKRPVLFISVFILLLISGCIKKSENPQNEMFVKSASPVIFSEIEDVDFTNFTYRYEENDKYDFSLKDGKKEYGKVNDDSFTFEKIQYADLTKDGVNEAVINLLHGQAVTSNNLIFVYSLQNGEPKMLWNISSEPELNGRLKEIYVKEKRLVIELFGKNDFNSIDNKFLFSKDYNPLQAFCCPKNFTKFVFDWNGEKFITSQTPQVIKYDPPK